MRVRHGASYFIRFIDDFICYDHIYLIYHNSKALEYFRLYLSEIENQLDKKIKTLRTHRGRKYLSEQFKELCIDKKITR